MVARYRHTQIGYVTIITLSIALIFIIVLTVGVGFHWILFFVFIIIGTCLALFATLSVIINDDFLEIRFGIGIIRKKFPLKNIEFCRIVKNPWYYGWGIRLTPHGWLYNVSGLSAVEIRMTNGKKRRIGTDVPQELEKALRQEIERINK